MTLERLVRLFQGPVAPISPRRATTLALPDDGRLYAPDVWEEVRDATISLLGGVTFADLAARAGGPWINSSLITPFPIPTRPRHLPVHGGRFRGWPWRSNVKRLDRR